MKSLRFLVVFLILSRLGLYSQTIGITSPVVSNSYCAGATVNVVYTISGTFSNSPSANVFSVELSDASGSFTNNPETIGTATSISGGTINCTFPSTLLTNNLYRIRISSSNPTVTSNDNGANLTVFAITLNTPTLGQTSYCQNETFTVNFTQSSCNFVNLPSTNVYSVELSDASGNFTAPVVIGTRTAVTSSTISCTIPPGTPPGNSYRIRVSASSPSVSSTDNGSNINIASTTGTPSVFGNGVWNVYCYAAGSNYTSNYRGFYTHTTLSFTTTSKWGSTASPSTAIATLGSAFTGCGFGANFYSYSYKRTNIPCGYYQIDVPTRGSEVAIIINGVTVYESTVCCTGTTNVWKDVILASDNVEIRCSKINAGGQGALTVNFTRLNEVSMSTPVTVCSASNASLTVTNTGTLPVAFSWTPSALVSPSVGTSVIGTPVVTTTFAAIGSISSCAVFSGSVVITVSATPGTTTSITSTVICGGLSDATITASGANTYSWQPSAGLNTTTGNIVIASPTVTTVYTVTGSNNCTTADAPRNVSVQTIPSSPSPTVFGSGLWNVFCYSNSSFTTLTGFYTENKISFTTTSRWAATSAPSAANSSSGTAHTGCNLTNASHGTIHKRTNFTCGYYSVNLIHDDLVQMYVDGVQVFQNATAATDNNAWTGFLGPLSEVELRHANTAGTTSSLAVAFSTLSIPVLSPPVTICAGTNATLTATNISGLNYSWTPSTSLSATSGTVTISNTSVSTNYTCTITDPVTSCTTANSTSVTVNTLPTTSVSLSLATINCTAQVYTLTATGANTYSWAPSAGLNTTSGNSVIANPTVSTVYTLTGDNNCSTTTATSSITVVPLVNPTVFPTGTWNAYCYNSTTFTNYFGYYTEDGSGPSTYDFNTTTRWLANAAPSTANAVNGNAYLGCTMPTTNYSLIFKRRGFTCNTYSIHVLNNDNNVTVLINGSSVATRATSTSTTALWAGVLSSSTTVELRLTQTTGTAALSVSFVPASTSPSINVWAGATSNNWFTSSNWCGGAPPTASTDVTIFNSGTSFQPVITASGAECNNLTIRGAVAASGSSLAIAAASLNITGAFGLDINGDLVNNGVFTGTNSTVNVTGNFTNTGTFSGTSSSLTVNGNFVNNGTYTGGSGTVNIVGTGDKTLSCSGTQTLNVLNINNSGSITIPSGTHRISSRLNLTSGIVVLSGSTFQMLNNSTVINASNSSYIEGTVIKTGNQAFTFPVGAAGYYRPITISAPVANTDAFTAQYIASDPGITYTFSSKDVAIDHVSRCEHWILNRTAGSSIVRVTLSWDDLSCGVSTPTDLVVCRWNGSTWKDHGNGGASVAGSSGTVISSAPVTAFSPFTLGSRTGLNPLPIELVDFKGECSNEGIHLSWVTATEFNNDYFTVECSADALNWVGLKKIPSLGDNHQLRQYVQTDVNAKNSARYYRLKQTDKDHQEKVFKTIFVSCEKDVNEFSFYPNPAAEEVQLSFQVKQDIEDGMLSILDQFGKVQLNGYLNLKKGSNLIALQIKLSPGIYYIHYQSAMFTSSYQKLIISE